MRFPPSLLDDIRARLPVSQVVARKVALKRAGREMKGLSPFKQERTPSFFVNDHKGSWFDFSSGQNGDIFKFVMLTEGLSFPEAVERLAEEAGLPIPKAEPARGRAGGRACPPLCPPGGRRPLLRGAAGAARRHGGAPLPRQARPHARRHCPLPPGLRAQRPVGAARAPRQGRLLDRGDGGLRHARHRRRHPRRLRPLPAPHHLPDHRPEGARDRLRRPRARPGGARQIPQLAGDPALPQGRQPLQRPQRPRRRPRQGAR